MRRISRFMVALFVLAIPAVRVEAAPPKTMKEAVELVRAHLAARIDAGNARRPLTAGPGASVKLVKVAAVRSSDVSFTTRAEVSSPGEKLPWLYDVHVMRADGRIVMGKAEGGDPGLPPYAALVRCAFPLLSLINVRTRTADSISNEDWSPRAFGDSYYCLIPVAGHRYLTRMPVQPIPSKLPAWARNDPQALEDATDRHYLPDAYPIEIYDEKFIRGAGRDDPAVRTALSLYPRFATSMGASRDPAVKPLKLEGWAKHGRIYAQTCRESAAAQVILSLGLLVDCGSWERHCLLLVGDGTPGRTFFATFDRSSIHHEAQWGRPVAGEFKHSGKVYSGIAEEIAAGNDSALTYAVNFPALMKLIEIAAKTEPKARRAIESIPSRF